MTRSEFRFLMLLALMPATFILPAIHCSPALAQTQNPGGTSTKVRNWLATDLGISVEKLAAKSDLLKDWRMDRGLLHETLLRLYAHFRVKPAGQELSRVEDIAAYIDASAKPRPLTRSMRSAPRTKSEKAYFVQRVYFATNREPTGNTDPASFFNGKRANDLKLRYGFADVNIPKSHKPGLLESPWRGIQMFRDRRSHIYVLKLNPLTEAPFHAELAKHGKGKSELLVFIHGYNTPFDRAVRRTAQISVDLGFQGVPITFSWPSDGQLTSYNADWSDVLWSVKYIETFLTSLKRKHPRRPIHLIAHSMGNKGLLHAMRLMAYREGEKARAKFASVLLCAPDFDAGLFSQQVAKEIRPLAANWTVYSSHNDFALIASETFNDAPRLGIPATPAEGFTIIDASEVEVTPWSVPDTHGYYATKKRVMDDMIAALKGLAPAQRGLEAKLTSGGSVWTLK